jgi:periplasmic protein TonB
MFEQSVLADAAMRRTSLFLFVTSAQVAAIAIGVITPLFWIVLPPIAKLPNPIRWAPAHIDLAPVPEELAAARPMNRRPLYLPVAGPIRVPNGILREVPAAPPDLLASGAVDLAMPNGVFSASDTMTRVPAPPPAPEHKEAPTEHYPVPVSQGVQEAKLIHRVLPIYPVLAIRTRQFGTVRLEAIIAKDGHIRDIRVLSGPVFLTAAAVEAVRQWLYKPTLLNGRPVEVVAPITVNFTLTQ